MLSCVIVTYHTGPVLTQCLEAVLAQNDPMELILVNNGNPSDVEQHLGKMKGDGAIDHLIDGHGNIGFGAACNLGATMASGEGIVYLNPDCIIPIDFSQRVQPYLSQNPDRLLGVRVVDQAGIPDRTNIRDHVSFFTVLGAKFPFMTLLTGGKRLNLDIPESFEETPYIVNGVSGCCLILSAQSNKSLGGYDTSYFLHFEDLDLFTRHKAAGGSIGYLHDLEVIHVKSSSNVAKSVVARQKWLSLFLYLSKHSQMGGCRAFWRFTYRLMA